MNKAAELVSDTILEESFKSIIIGGKVVTLYPPSVKTICRMVSAFSKMDMEGKYNSLSIMAESEKNVPHLIRGLSYALAGDGILSEVRAKMIRRRLWKVPFKELRECFEDVISLIGGDDFFACATFARQLCGAVAKEAL